MSPSPRGLEGWGTEGTQRGFGVGSSSSRTLAGGSTASGAPCAKCPRRWLRPPSGLGPPASPCPFPGAHPRARRAPAASAARGEPPRTPKKPFPWPCGEAEAEPGRDKKEAFGVAGAGASSAPLPAQPGLLLGFFFLIYIFFFRLSATPGACPRGNKRPTHHLSDIKLDWVFPPPFVTDSIHVTHSLPEPRRDYGGRGRLLML